MSIEVPARLAGAHPMGSVEVREREDLRADYLDDGIEQDAGVELVTWSLSATGRHVDDVRVFLSPSDAERVGAALQEAARSAGPIPSVDDEEGP